jgi:hypothetical protein
MKISTLGQKKNNELTAPIEANYPLPDLSAPKPQVVATPQPAITQEVKQATVAPAPQPQPTIEQVPTVNPTPVAQAPAAAPVAEPKPAAEPVAVVKPTPAPAVAPTAAEKPKSVLLGGSLASLLDKVSNPEGEGKGAAIVVDPQSEAKLEKVKEQIIKQMCAERPRFVSAFESISFEGNTVKLAVPSEALKDELLGERFWILKSIAELAGVNGSLDMFIEIKEMDFKLKPIKLEDRVAHIRKVMPEFDYMQKALDMDVE